MKRPIRHVLLLLLIAASDSALAEYAPVCLYVSSYHPGYDWSDRLEAGLRRELGDRCILVSRYMDTKRNRSVWFKRAAGRRANEAINELNPDVIVIADDNAAKYLVEPYLRNVNTPVVFTGINWTVDEYGLPFDNTTGIVELAPIEKTLTQARSMSRGGRNGTYLAADTLTERKNYRHIAGVAESMGLTLTARFTNRFQGWIDAFLEAQSLDFVLLGSTSGIDDWNPKHARLLARHETRVPSLTNHDWMMPYAVFGYTMVPEEHGRWAALTAIAILDGLPPSDIPVIASRHYDTWLNETLMSRAALEVSALQSRKAKKLR